MSQVDLHLHSTASDGRLSPAEVVRKSAGLGLTVIALTDHNSVEEKSIDVSSLIAEFEHLKEFPNLASSNLNFTFL